MKTLGTHLCSRCLIVRADVLKLGMEVDMKHRVKKARVDTQRRQKLILQARRWIFEREYAVNGNAIKRLLDSASLVPIVNAFSESFSKFGVNFFEIFTCDLLHDFEIGVWKATLTHMIRILHACKGGLVSILDERFRKVPSFRRCICRFTSALLPWEHDVVVRHLLYILLV